MKQIWLFITWSTNSTIKDEGWSFDYTVDGVGIEENFEYDNLSIYPNPTTGLLNVSFDIEKSEKLEVQLYEYERPNICKLKPVMDLMDIIKIISI